MTRNAAHSDLLDAARDLIERRFTEGKHQVAAALRATDGTIYTGLHVEAYVGRIAVCAEAAAIAKGCEHGPLIVEAVVAVDHAGRSVTPCGMCRELIYDYGPEAVVLCPAGDGHETVPIAELLPRRYRRQD